MQWSAEKYAGFSNVEAWISSPDNYREINVAVEEKDPDSILNFYKQLVKIREENKIVQEGDISFIERDNNDVIAYRRTLDGAEWIILCNYRGTETSLQDKTLSAYVDEGYKKILGNFEGIAENLRPYELIVFEK